MPSTPPSGSDPGHPALRLLRGLADERPALVWRLPRPALSVATAPLGGGWGIRHWVVDVQADTGYRRDDPAAHLADLAATLCLDGEGLGLLTAADVTRVTTATETKTQALAQLGVPGTGTPSDAVCVLCPPDGTAEPFGGPRSRWGAPLARAVDHAVLAGGQAHNGTDAP